MAAHAAHPTFRERGAGLTTMARWETPEERRRRHRRSARTIVPIGLILVGIGALLNGWGGTLGFLGLVLLFQGGGLLVAGLSLVFGHNPLDKD